MPLAYAIEPAARVVAVTGDPFSAAAARTLFAAVAADPHFRPGLHFLVDRRADPAVPTAAEVRALVPVLTELGRAGGPCRLAFVVASPAAYGMARMAAALAAGTAVEVAAFRDPGAARRWLAGDADALCE